MPLQLSVILGASLAAFMSQYWSYSIALQGYLMPLTAIVLALALCQYAYIASRSSHSPVPRFSTRLTLQRITILCCLFTAAFIYFNINAKNLREKWQALEHKKHDIEVLLTVKSLVHSGVRSHRYDASIDAVFSPLKSVDFLLGETVTLSDYKASEHGDIQPCDKIRAVIRLKPIRGTANHSSFDYERFAFSKRLMGKAYIREWSGTVAPKGFDKWLCANRLRQAFKSLTQKHLSIEQGAWLHALAIGDKSGFTSSQRQFLSESQLAHLFVISGLHVGIAAAWIYALGLLLFKRLSARINVQPLVASAWLSIIGSAVYVAMTGSSLSAMRALIMIIAIFSGRISGFHWSIPFRLGLAFIVSFLLWPLSLLNTGFWLSYVAVFSIYIYSLSIAKPLHSTYKITSVNAAPYSLLREKLTGYGRHYILLQLFIFTCLLPLTFSFNQSLNVFSPLMNLVAIPVISLIFVPASMLLLLLFPLVEILTPVTGVNVVYAEFVQWVAYLLASFINGLVGVNDATSALQMPLGSSRVSGVLVIILMFVSVMTAALCGWMKWYKQCAASVLILLGACIFQLVVNRQESTELNVNGSAGDTLQLQVFDVGQGLAILAEVQGRVLLYDTGKSWQDGSMAESVIIPYLRNKHIRSLDKLILSHLDNDHAGGAKVLLQQLSVNSLISSDLHGLREKAFSQDRFIQRCQQGLQWQWGAFNFEFFHPAVNQFKDGKLTNSKQRNDSSCVLLISNHSQAVLLLGDISKKIELALLKNSAFMSAVQRKSLNVVLAHHGSKYSSHKDFLRGVNPKLAIASAAYLNRFKHPHPDVINRLKKLDIPYVSTAQTGQISLEIMGEFGFSSVKQREIWQDRVWNVAYAP